MNKFGQRLRSARLAAVMSQRELAQAAKVGENYLGVLERGSHQPRPGTIRRLAAALGVSARWLAVGPPESTRDSHVGA